MIVSPSAHTPVDDRARLSNRALEAHHYPLAGEAGAARVRAVWQARSGRIEVHY